MRIDTSEVELARDEEQNSPHRCELSVSARLAFRCLEEAARGLDAVIGLTAGTASVEAVTGHSGGLLRRIDLGTPGGGARLREHRAYDADLPAVGNFAQMFTIEPRPRCALDLSAMDRMQALYIQRQKLDDRDKADVVRAFRGASKSSLLMYHDEQTQGSYQATMLHFSTTMM